MKGASLLMRGGPAKRLRLGAEKLQLYGYLECMGASPFHHADAPGEALRLVDRSVQLR